MKERLTKCLLCLVLAPFLMVLMLGLAFLMPVLPIIALIRPDIILCTTKEKE